MNKSLTLGAASAALLLTLTGCGDSGTDQSAATTGPAAVTTPVNADNGAGEHNDADVTFAEGMAPHHSQAIEMSDMLLGKLGIDPRVVDLAQQIKAEQGPELEQLNAWLTEWGQVPAATTTTGMNMPGGGEDMGMMSAEDMAALDDAQGVEATKLFLTQMTEHHTGAITMAQTEVADGQKAQAKAMAQNIITTQQQELTTMEQLLSTL
ncbi:DUF305 domain-containing protein [Rhodococcus erythropolis]|uniref:DUF305 domain-containing protein n=1 Tax=Rhodococcus erythropolis TaxID=1833 RepID=UPI0029495BEA|nr:DUF305 domain-containing protein [Rhodococcus erythropolis]MDV6278596.1 DUF305 domain-containing protein [Rhodococcus erythropolis]